MTYDDLKLPVMLEAIAFDLEQILKTIRTKDTAMKYALESLPELIGADDFADICELLGMTDWTRREIPTGQEFAKRVRNHVTQMRVRCEVKRSNQPGALL